MSTPNPLPYSRPRLVVLGDITRIVLSGTGKESACNDGGSVEFSAKGQGDMCVKP